MEELRSSSVKDKMQGTSDMVQNLQVESRSWSMTIVRVKVKGRLNTERVKSRVGSIQKGSSQGAVLVQ